MNAEPTHNAPPKVSMSTYTPLGVSSLIHVVGGERAREVGPNLFFRQQGQGGEEKMQHL